MESVAARVESPWGRLLPRLDSQALSAWALTGAIVLYLAIDGGGYDVVVHSQVGLVVWWIVLVGSVWGLLPAVRLTRTAWIGLGLFAAFVGWIAIATTWSLSTERSLQQLSLVACYLGILVLAVAIHRDRERALHHTLNALGVAIVIVAVLAVGSRLRPDLFPSSAQQTAQFLPGTRERLSWPLNYWNALGALMAFGAPLLLAIATSARSLYGQAIGAAGLPIVALCGYLTFSRGSAIAMAVALVVFLALAHDRIFKLATALAAAAGSGVLIAGAAHRSAIEQGLAGPVARHQGASLSVAVILVCAGVALVQVGIGLAVRHGTPPRWLSPPVRHARAFLAIGMVACITAVLLAGGAARLSHAWRDFKHPTAPALHNYSVSRFGILSGNGRYDLWKAAIDATGGHVLGGSGPGTYQLLWLQREPYLSYAQNAHSLYFETLAETGIVGLGLLLCFFGVVVRTAVQLLRRSRYELRTRAAAGVAAIAAFLLSAASDWIWQVPALPAAFLVLTAALFAPSVRSAQVTAAESRERSPRGGLIGQIALRVVAVSLAAGCLVAISVPLATTTAIRRSQAAAADHNLGYALADAREAAALEPGSATPQLQLALVLEERRDFRGALEPALRAVQDEPKNWSTWFVVSRLQAELGHPAASLAAYSTARSLNPQSPIFRQ